MFLFDLTEIERRVPFPFPVRTMGGMNEESSPLCLEYPYPDVFEFSLRFSSEEKEAIDYIDGDINKYQLTHYNL